MTWRTIDTANNKDAAHGEVEANENVLMEGVAFRRAEDGEANEDGTSKVAVNVKIETYAKQSKTEHIFVWCSSAALVLLLLTLWVYFG